MAATAGLRAEAGRIPGERIATTIATSDSSTFTTSETQIMSVTASVVTGRIYRLRFVGRLSTTTAGDQGVARLRETNTSGTELQSAVVDSTNTSGTLGTNPLLMEVEWTASSTGSQTWIASAFRNSGSGTWHMEAGSNRPNYLYLDYISG